MAAFIRVTDSLTGEPVAVNIENVQTFRTRKGEDSETTILDFGKNFVQCTESMDRIASMIVRAVSSPH